MTELANTPDWWSDRARTIEDDSEAVCWSFHSQDVRFRAVRSLLTVSVGDTVLDWGCGTGAFLEVLPAPFITYYGLDWSEGMRERVRDAYPDVVVIADNELSDDDVFDHVVCIGPFNLRENWSKERTWETLEELWTMHTRKTLVVSLYAGAERPGMIRYGGADALELVERLSFPRMEITSRHLPNDLIVAAWK